MSVTYHTLASGSAGNSALVRAGDTGVLIDIGMDERLIAHRLAATGHGWRDVNAVLLTHAHSDHWTDLSLAQIRRQKTLFYCHPDHELLIRRPDGEFAALRQAGLVRSFRDGEPIRLSELLTVTPVQVPHDSDPTFAFRIDGLSPEGQEWSLAHASDLGMCPQELFDVFRDVDLLALEFNHDVAMQRASGRPRRLIDRVLGDQGHLAAPCAIAPEPGLQHADDCRRRGPRNPCRGEKRRPPDHRRPELPLGHPDHHGVSRFSQLPLCDATGQACQALPVVRVGSHVSVASWTTELRMVRSPGRWVME